MSIDGRALFAILLRQQKWFGATTMLAAFPSDVAIGLTHDVHCRRMQLFESSNHADAGMISELQM
jgi:hypothetical protein